MTQTKLHPDLGAPRAIAAPVDGGIAVNIAAVVQMIREGDTPQCRAAYRHFTAAWRKLEGQPITDKAREWQAFEATARAMGWNIVQTGQE
jgi:hypothetical protein